MLRAKTDRSAGNRVLVVGLLAVLITVGLMLSAKPAHAKTFTVTTTSDSGAGSLRQAILDTNDIPGADNINFNIPSSGVRTIFPRSELPQITDTVTIDGYCQPGASTNTLAKGTNAILKIQLDGSSAGNFADGLSFGSGASNSIVKGLVINRFGGDGIDMFDARDMRIEGNFIGTDSSGTLDLGNGLNGVLVHGNSTSNAIGGTSRFQRNLISGNIEGITLNFNAERNEVLGNLVGTKKDGISPLGNEFAGVVALGADNFVGDFSQSGANTIAFNGGNGVSVSVSSAAGNRILSNSIFSNGRLGIDLRGGTENAAGATANDPKDADTGPNDLQNKPVVTSAVTSGGDDAHPRQAQQYSQRRLPDRVLLQPLRQRGSDPHRRNDRQDQPQRQRHLQRHPLPGGAGGAEGDGHSPPRHRRQQLRVLRSSYGGGTVSA